MTTPACTLDVRFMTTGDDLAALEEWLATDHGILALDVETTGLDTLAVDFDVRQVCLAGADGTAVVLDGRDPILVKDALRLAMRSTTRPWWAHNARFDRLAIATAFGLRLSRLRCSMTLVQTVEPDRIGVRGATSLKTLRPATEAALRDLLRHAEVVLGRPGLDKSALAEVVGALPPSDPVLLAYVAADAGETARLVAEWDETLSGQTRTCVARETKVDAAWTWPGLRGYRVDLEALGWELRDLEAARTEALEHWGVDLTTTSHASRHWVAERGIQITDLDGKATLSAKHFDRARVPAEAADDWAAFRRIREISTTANKLNELAGLVDQHGRLYPEIKAIGAHTGRQSIGKPALQNLPERLRSLLLADPGMTLVGCDLDRVEPRVIAALTGDTALTAAVQADVYTELAVAVWGEEARGDERARKVAKTAFLAMAYGQGQASLAANLGITSEEARAVLDGLLAGYPRMAAWMRDTKRAAREGRSVSTAFGRPLPETSDRPYRLVNWIIQGTAADLFKTITLDVADRLGGDALWLPVHDELIVQVPEGQVDNAVEVLRDAMETELLGVPISGTPVLLGDRWRKA